LLSFAVHFLRLESRSARYVFPIAAAGQRPGPMTRPLNEKTCRLRELDERELVRGCLAEDHRCQETLYQW